MIKYASKTCAISKDSKYLAVGCKNGSFEILDPTSLEEKYNIQRYINPDKDLISLIKFSPNSKILAVAYSPPISRIVLFDMDN